MNRYCCCAFTKYSDVIINLQGESYHKKSPNAEQQDSLIMNLLYLLFAYHASTNDAQEKIKCLSEFPGSGHANNERRQSQNDPAF